MTDVTEEYKIEVSKAKAKSIERWVKADHDQVAGFFGGGLIGAVVGYLNSPKSARNSQNSAQGALIGAVFAGLSGTLIGYLRGRKVDKSENRTHNEDGTIRHQKAEAPTYLNDGVDKGGAIGVPLASAFWTLENRIDISSKASNLLTWGSLLAPIAVFSIQRRNQMKHDYELAKSEAEHPVQVSSYEFDAIPLANQKKWTESLESQQSSSQFQTR